MELATALVDLIQTISAPVINWWKNHRGVDEYMETLKEKLEELNCRKQDRESRMMEELLPEERRPRKRQKKEVELWLGKVEKMNGEMKTIEQRVEEVKYLSRASVGKIVLNKIHEVEELHQEGVFLDGLVEAVPKSGDTLPATKLEGEISTPGRKMEEIWACLLNDEVRKIGVYGMSGIGKTSILKHINNRLLEHSKKFDNVIWVTVSMASNNSTLQDAIAGKLHLDISKYDDEITRAARIYEALGGKKRFVLILDDLWEVFPLEDVGIPEPSLANGCKLVLATQFLHVCHGMSCISIRMELLSNVEAMKLFLEIVGHGVLSVPNLNPIVKDIVKECARLPLAIVVIAGSLKGIVDYYEWKTALEELKAPIKGPHDMGSKVTQKLKVSFNRLKDKKLQDCLLYCALYPEDFMIERRRLIRCLIDEGIIEGMDSCLAEFGRGHAMLNKLERACLLEGSSEFGCKFVKMHGLVRDMALDITSVNPRYLVEAGIGSKGIPTEQKWAEDLVKVSLMWNRITQIPPSASPKCPSLSTLILRGSELLHDIPDCFFMHMENLNVIDLSYTNIKILPSSISHLANLTSLLLGGCKSLKNVRSLAKLQALKRLDCRNTAIEEVPQGLEMLVNLRYLNLHAKLLKQIADGVLQKLSNLQHLALPSYFSRTLKVNVEELASLKKLEIFDTMFPDIHHFNVFVKSLEGREMIASYTFHVGFNYLKGFYRYDRGLILIHCILGENLVGNYCSVLLPQGIQFLQVMNCLLVSLCRSFASLKDAVDLRKCILSGCYEMEYLLFSSSIVVPILQGLEQLDLDRLWKLRALVKRESFASCLLPVGTFSSLEKLSVFDCPNIKSLFTPALLSHLQNLKQINVHRCEQMVHLIAASSDDEGHDNVDGDRIVGVVGETSLALPKLKALRLWGLPELKSISNCGEADLVADSLEEILILNCPKLKRIDRLFGKKLLGDPPPSLWKIKVEKKWWESLEFDHSNTRDVLQPLCKFEMNVPS